jgi:hypothetical protein
MLITGTYRERFFDDCDKAHPEDVAQAAEIL